MAVGGRLSNSQLTFRSSKPQVLVLVGPTASGKTEVALQLAGILDGDIISADSRQIFKYLDIGTAKPSVEQRRTVRHYFVDELPPDADFNAGEFGIRGRTVIEQILSGGKTPIVVGGSGLYVVSLIDGFFGGPGADKEYRDRLEKKVALGRVTDLIEELRVVDPEAAGKADPTKPRRIIRALEVHHVTGKPLSQLHRENRIEVNFEPRLYGLEWERRVLYERINRRCEEMITGGLLREVERLERRGYTDALNALNTVGYVEVFAYRRGEISYEEMLRLFKQNSRRYAKRQLTWFRRDPRVRWMKMSPDYSAAEIALEIAQLFRSAPPSR